MGIPLFIQNIVMREKSIPVHMMNKPLMPITERNYVNLFLDLFVLLERRANKSIGFQ